MQSRLCWITTGISWEIGLGRGEGGAAIPHPNTHILDQALGFHAGGICTKDAKTTLGKRAPMQGTLLSDTKKEKY